MARHPSYLILPEEDLLTIQQMLTTGYHSARVLKRARILLYNHEGHTLESISQLLSLNYVSVSGIVKDYRDGGLSYALYDLPRSGAGRKITEEVEAHTTAIACSEPPEGCVRWTIELIRDELVRLNVVEDISKTSTHTILKKANSNLGKKFFGASKR